jgi:hypothetical protein
MPDLTLERREQPDKTGVLMGGAVMMTPPVDENYWAYRVKLGETGQAVVGFPKMSTIGIGFAREDDWNTNLPYTSDARDIALHIMHNKRDKNIAAYEVVEAIKLIQKAVREDRGEPDPDA